MELVEGLTLAERIAGGPLSVEESVNIAGQIAEAIEAAHEKGIIHRDLKPANVKITPDDQVKVLDFGLAKAMREEGSVSDPATSPTITENFTQPGVMLETAAYMSPEQARGRPVDKRSDVWSFGCVLYECLTGRAAFQGPTITDLLGAVLKDEPDWNVLPSDRPHSLQRLLQRLLIKDRNRRLRDMGDVSILLKDDTSADDLAVSPRQDTDGLGRNWKTYSGWITATCLALAGIWFYARCIRFDAGATPETPVRLHVAIDDDRPFSISMQDVQTSAAIHPTGSGLPMSARVSQKGDSIIAASTSSPGVSFQTREVPIVPSFLPTAKSWPSSPSTN